MEKLGQWTGLGGWGDELPPVADTKPNITDLQQQDDPPSNALVSVGSDNPVTSAARVESTALVVLPSLFSNLDERLAADRERRQRIDTELVGAAALATRDQAFEDAEVKYTKTIGARIVAELTRDFNAKLDDENRRVNDVLKQLEELLSMGVCQVNPEERQKCIKSLTSPSFEFSQTVVVSVSDLKEMEQVAKILAKKGKYQGPALQAVLSTLDKAIQGVAIRVCVALADVFEEAVREFSKCGTLVWEIPGNKEGGVTLGESWEREQAALEAGSPTYKREGAEREHWIKEVKKAGNEAYNEDATYIYTNQATVVAGDKQSKRDLREAARQITVRAVLTLNREPNMNLVNQVWPEGDAPPVAQQRSAAPTAVSKSSRSAARSSGKPPSFKEGSMDEEFNTNKSDLASGSTSGDKKKKRFFGKLFK